MDPETERAQESHGPGCPPGDSPSAPTAAPASPAQGDAGFEALACAIAVRTGLLSQAQADEALRAVAAEAGPDRLARACVARGWLTEEQAHALSGSALTAAAAAPGAADDEARHFGRLVTMKRLAADGQVEACRALQRELAGSPYERLGALLVEKARRRGEADPPLALGRDQAFDAYVKLKHAVRRGAVEEAEALGAVLRDHPEFGRLAALQVTRARTRRALSRRPAAGHDDHQGEGVGGVEHHPME